MRSSNASAPCRFELRPSRALAGVMLMLAVLVPWAALSSDLPTRVGGIVAVLAVCFAVGLAMRELRRTAQAVVIDASGAATIDGQAVEALRIDWRGTLGFVSWRDAAGRIHRRSLWPDTLSPALRRELRLAVPASGAVRGTDSMSP
jgi:toxin CptA